MTLEQPRTAVPYRRLSALVVCVVLVALTITWTFLGMRAVMDVGGACAEGGPYEIAQPCPDGTWMLALAIPVMIIAAMGGSGIAIGLGAPNLLMPMWLLLFGSLGWNFLEYGAFSGELVWGWIVCGVVFELMALPVLVLALHSVRSGDRWLPTTGRPATGAPDGGWWWPAYAGLGFLGCVLALWSFNAWS
jgi:hypothetical protein